MASINTNMSATLAVSNLNKTTDEMTSVLTAMSSGKAINSASDDPAGLKISNRMTAQINGLGQAVTNAQHAVSMVETAEGGTQEISNMLHRMRELAVASQNGTNLQADRNAMQGEFEQLQWEIERIADNTQFNGQNVLDGTAGGTRNISGGGVTTKANVQAVGGGWIQGLTNHEGNMLAVGDELTYHQGTGAALIILSAGVYSEADFTDGMSVFVVNVDAGNSTVQLGPSAGANAWAYKAPFGNDTQWFTQAVDVVYQIGANTNQGITVAFGDFQTPVFETPLCREAKELEPRAFVNQRSPKNCPK